MSPLFEMVPNLSEGRDFATIDAASAAIESGGARVLHRTSDSIHHRSVLTAVGDADQVLRAAIGLAGVAVERIDLRVHGGVHPRIGALDVLPFVPLREATMEQATALAHRAGEQIWERYRVPSFYYGAAARVPEREQLAAVRRGEFEGLEARFEFPEWKPDVGDVSRHASAGAIAIGARELLVAFNVNLASGNLALARAIAGRIRARDGGFRTLRALGLRLRDDLVQVSLNIANVTATPLARVVEVIRSFAEDAGVRIAGCELIGCVPAAAIEEACRYYLGVPHVNEGNRSL
jgi:glutamate formiminotransferase / 5-formyltetrahydrofolate cyclo-ligase